MGAAAREPLWRSYKISNEQGLSNSSVNCLFQDSRGYMWFGTWDGLNRFDGKNIQTFYPDSFDTLSLSNNIIRNILEDQHGALWVVTERGMDRYSHDEQIFQTWFSDYPELSLEENSVKARLGPDGNIWVNASGIGAFRYSSADREFIPVSFPEASRQLVQDFYIRGNTLFLLEQQVLRIYNLNDAHQPDLVNNMVLETPAKGIMDKSWLFEFEDQVFLARAFRESGLQIVNLRNGEFYDPGDVALKVTALNPGLDGSFIWLGTDDGNVFRYFPATSHLEDVTSQISPLAGKKVKIWSILETSEDLLWIGTDGEGIFYSLLNPKPFFQIQRGEAAHQQLNHKIVRAIYEDQQGNLWVGTRGNGMNLIPAADQPTKYYNTDNGLSNNAVLSINEDLDKNLWIGHDGMGIDVLDKASGRFYHFPDDLYGGEHLEFGSVYAICIDAFGQVWLGTSGYGVIGLDVSKKNGRYILDHFQHFHNEGLSSTLKSNIVYSIVEEKPNILWFGTRGAGVYRFNTLTGQSENFQRSSVLKQGLIDNDILSLKMSSEGILWVGSSGGLTAVNINYSPYSFQHYNLKNGLPSNTIHAILEDPQGNIWVSTNKGLSKWDIRKQLFMNFNHADGLQSNEYTDGAAEYGQRSGRFYFGGINGLDWFYPQDIKTSERMSPLVFTGFRLYNRRILPGDSILSLPGNIDDLEEIVLKHHQNFFTVEFSTLNFVNPDKTMFQYKLEGFNSDWVFAAHQREANFTNVPFGKYRLLVKATNEDAIWQDETREISIVILPPFWKTWPAYVFYVLILVLTGYLIYRVQSHGLLIKQKRTLERLQQEKENELNHYKLQFFTNMAHEFGTPLTLILASSASLLNNGPGDDKSSALLKSIYDNSRRMQRLVNELLEFRKIDAGREKLVPVKTELVNNLQKIVDAFSHFAREHELDISFEPEMHDLWIKIDKEKLEKIMLNLLSNAIKYTPSGGSIRVMLSRQANQVNIDVADTGIGIPDEALSQVFNVFYQNDSAQKRPSPAIKGTGIGLAYTRALVELMQGKIWVESVPDKGSTFHVLLPVEEVSSGWAHPATSGSEQLFQSISEAIVDNKSDLKTKSVTHPKLWTIPRKFRILVAEDDKELSNFLFNMLSEQYDVVLADDGNKALELIRTTRIDLLVSDIMMPLMDGLALCRMLKKDLLTSHIPVILLTAKSDIEQRIQGLEMGADSYIPKPFHPRHLFVRIEKLLRNREQVFQHFKATFGTPSYSSQNEFSPRDNRLLEKCINYIYENYPDENLDAERLASYLALSKAQLYRKIKALTGLTPHGLIKNFRLKKARQMLSDGKHSITDIIFLTGFNNRTYFYRSYKEVFGETPGELNKS
ncbi:MAG: two-component regulator propeller domain-containing protein [Bacteroidales bacterium]